MKIWNDSVSEILQYEDAKIIKELGDFLLWEADTNDFICSVDGYNTKAFTTLCNDTNEQKIIALWNNQKVVTPIVLMVSYTKDKLRILDGNHRFRVFNVFTQNRKFNTKKVLFITPYESQEVSKDNPGKLVNFVNEQFIKNIIPSAKKKAIICR